MKIIYFVKNGVTTPEDLAGRLKLQGEGHKVYFSNGSIPWGFEDSCDAVYLAGEFGHVRSWCLSKGIVIISDKVEPEVKAKETKHEEKKPRPRRASKPEQED